VFLSEKTLQPVFMSFDKNSFIPSLNIPTLAMITMSMCKPTSSHCTINVLPDFQPNEFLFENHKNSEYNEGKENERWETFAWATRDIMIKAGNFDKRTFTWAENHKYEIYMNKENNVKPPILEHILNSNAQNLVLTSYRTALIQ